MHVFPGTYENRVKLYIKMSNAEKKSSRSLSISRESVYSVQINTGIVVYLLASRWRWSKKQCSMPSFCFLQFLPKDMKVRYNYMIDDYLFSCWHYLALNWLQHWWYLQNELRFEKRTNNAKELSETLMKYWSSEKLEFSNEIKVEIYNSSAVFSKISCLAKIRQQSTVHSKNGHDVTSIEFWIFRQIY